MHSWQPKFVPTHPLRFLDGQRSLMEGEIFKLWNDTSQSRNPSFLVALGLLKPLDA
ncbi:hypothetical protein Taro_047708 [Colocasia esculenta]|uniref:Uncharacterized protein n=1 Tax=Colocasia esculenta TaxID=4460 RepID=A0A843WTN4_COLES|nr:hypothetical protein [Colocasia esculenta]